MAYEILTVGHLKEAIANLADDVPVVLCQGADAGPGASMEAANGVFFVDEAEDPEDDAPDYLNRSAIVLTSGYLSPDQKALNPVSER